MFGMYGIARPRCCPPDLPCRSELIRWPPRFTGLLLVRLSMNSHQRQQLRAVIGRGGPPDQRWQLPSASSPTLSPGHRFHEWCHEAVALRLVCCCRCRRRDSPGRVTAGSCSFRSAHLLTPVCRRRCTDVPGVSG